MICPHCRKPLPRLIKGTQVSKDAILKIAKLRSQGYSFRDIERLLFEEKILVSAATACRLMKQKKM